ncbi:MAG: AlbA family DNA-binding domain-containing protein [Bacteroidota bacterium]
MSRSEKTYLRSLIDEGEHQQLDFKFEISDAKKIARTLSAFSNTDGGRLLIGVKDNGRISGIRSDEEYYMVESAASLFCKPEVHFESKDHTIEGKNVLEIYIPPATVRPVYAKDDQSRWMAYIRVADENILADIIQLEVWKNEKKRRGKLLRFTRIEKIVLTHLGRDAGSSLAGLQKDTGLRRKALISMLVKLILFDVVEMIYREGEVLYRLKEKPGESGQM